MTCARSNESLSVCFDLVGDVVRCERVRFHPDAVDRAVRAAARRRRLERLDDVLFREVDRVGAELARALEPVRDAVDRDHALGAQQERALDREPSDRAAAPDRDGVAGRDLRLLRGLPAGREDVGEEQHLLVGQTFGHDERVRVGVGDAHVLRLTAGIAAERVRVAVQTAAGVAEQQVRHPRVGVRVVAQRGHPVATVQAAAARDRERHDHAVADGFTFRTALPTSTISPMNSWPNTSPFFTVGM